MSKLTPIQKEFIKELFSTSTGNVKAASLKVLGTEDYSSIMTDELLAEIRKRADSELVLQAPKAIHVLSQMLENPENTFFIDKLSKVAQDILDRGGISKKESSGTGQMAIGVVFLPSKIPLPEPPALEHEKTIEGPILLENPINLNDLQTQSTS